MCASDVLICMGTSPYTFGGPCSNSHYSKIRFSPKIGNTKKKSWFLFRMGFLLLHTTYQVSSSGDILHRWPSFSSKQSFRHGFRKNIQGCLLTDIPYQSAFISDRNILDNTILADEMIYGFGKKYRKSPAVNLGSPTSWDNQTRWYIQYNELHQQYLHSCRTVTNSITAAAFCVMVEGSIAKPEKNQTGRFALSNCIWHSEGCSEYNDNRESVLGIYHLSLTPNVSYMMKSELPFSCYSLALVVWKVIGSTHSGHQKLLLRDIDCFFVADAYKKLNRGSFPFEASGLIAWESITLRNQPVVLEFIDEFAVVGRSKLEEQFRSIIQIISSFWRNWYFSASNKSHKIHYKRPSASPAPISQKVQSNVA